MELSKKQKTLNNVFRIIYLLLYVFVTSLIIFSLVDAKIKDNTAAEDAIKMSYALTFIFVALILGAISYGFLLILGLVNIIIAATRKENPYRKRYVLRSSLTIILPLITFVLIILIGKMYT